MRDPCLRSRLLVPSSRRSKIGMIQECLFCLLLSMHHVIVCAYCCLRLFASVFSFVCLIVSFSPLYFFCDTNIHISLYRFDFAFSKLYATWRLVFRIMCTRKYTERNERCRISFNRHQQTSRMWMFQFYLFPSCLCLEVCTCAFLLHVC